MKKPELIFSNSEFLSSNKKRAMVAIEICRDIIEEGRIGSVIESLLVLIDSKENAILYKESLVFFVSGYDSDKRELAEIPEVRLFFQNLVKHWPHFGWFLFRGNGMFRLLFSFICEVEFFRGEKKEMQMEFKNRSEFIEKVNDMLSRSNYMLSGFNFSIDEVLESTRTMMDDFWGR